MLPPQPNFFLVGVPKAGTTALYADLSAHPDVFMPSEKEPHYFSEKPRRDGSVMTAAEYAALFAPWQGEAAIGEASPSYFHPPEVPERLHAHDPEARILVSLRHPVERAFSHYLMLVNSGAAPPDGFEAVFRTALQRVAEGKPPDPVSSYRQSRYADALTRYHQHFPAEHIHVVLHEEYRREPWQVMRGVYAFLGVDASFEGADLGERRNAGSGLPRSQRMHALVFGQNPVKGLAQKVLPPRFRRRVAERLVARNRTRKPTLSSELRAEFMQAFEDDVERLEALLGRSLDLWR